MRNVEGIIFVNDCGINGVFSIGLTIRQEGSVIYEKALHQLGESDIHVVSNVVSYYKICGQISPACNSVHAIS